ncbi:cell division protein ZipA C-terminal FtsZ-binding domain-containing protein [Thiomicrorhabdus cannonii]|uniref:cell division protein ZipA C-terminal FtsZ-binding domain-containing protein n=1 Tax=Thiomicrorhabdus cannonii TaxID=2748011 RepID=UPI0015BE20C3|nr:cell division protein ZipA C-terminal FtsZ-binding domain-containing protein [Thiomicrorhabdus cannonii]
MNELQQVLLIFAIVVIGVLFFLSKKRQAKSKSNPENVAANTSQATTAARQQASRALNGLGEEHPGLSPQTVSRLHIDDSQPQLGEEPQVPENQAKLPFDDEFQLQPTNVSDNESAPADGPKHHVLHVEELYTLEELNAPSASSSKVKFGIPPERQGESPGQSQGAKTEPEIFALLVLSTGGSGQEFGMEAVNQALLGVGLSFSKNHIYVTTDSKGREIIRVANILEPGTFPTENLQNHTTPGIALILQLPTSIRAPAAMHDLIMMARKISQRLNGRLYNMERHLIKESDLQAMRDAAVEYESVPL